MAPATDFIVKFRKAAAPHALVLVVGQNELQTDGRGIDWIREYPRPRDRKLRLSDVKELFELMRK